jgi:hypothetical protein
MKKTIEQKTGDAVLQRSEDFICDGERFPTSAPCLETLIIASEHISLLPAMPISFEGENAMFNAALFLAKDCRPLGDICAVLILGAKNLKTVRTIRETIVVKPKGFWPWQKEITRVVESEIEIDNVKILSQKLRLNYLPSALHDLMKEELRKMEVSDFFGLSTSLIEINLLQQTRGVEETTASGE